MKVPSQKKQKKNQKRNLRKAYVTFLVVTFIFSAHTLFAEVMTSGTYKIQSDSVNFGGGLGNSSNYKVEDTYGEVGTGESQSTTYKLKAGYQQMQEVYLAITSAADVTMSPSLGGLSGGTSNGSTAVTVTTDGGAGYQLLIKASTSPALKGENIADSIADYTPAVAGTPDYVFDPAIPATASEFGYTAEGSDIAQRFKDDGFSCNQPAGSDTADTCWYGLSTSNEVVSSRSTGNHPSGVATTIKYRTYVGSSRVQTEGIYNATTTLTAISL